MWGTLSCIPSWHSWWPAPLSSHFHWQLPSSIVPCEQSGVHLHPEPIGSLEYDPKEGGKDRSEGEERRERGMEKQGCEHEWVQSRHKGDCKSIYDSLYKITSLLETRLVYTDYHTSSSTSRPMVDHTHTHSPIPPRPPTFSSFSKYSRNHLYGFSGLSWHILAMHSFRIPWIPFCST